MSPGISLQELKVGDSLKCRLLYTENAGGAGKFTSLEVLNAQSIGKEWYAVQFKPSPVLGDANKQLKGVYLNFVFKTSPTPTREGFVAFAAYPLSSGEALRGAVAKRQKLQFYSWNGNIISDIGPFTALQLSTRK